MRAPPRTTTRRASYARAACSTLATSRSCRLAHASVAPSMWSRSRLQGKFIEVQFSLDNALQGAYISDCTALGHVWTVVWSMPMLTIPSARDAWASCAGEPSLDLLERVPYADALGGDWEGRDISPGVVVVVGRDCRLSTLPAPLLAVICWWCASRCHRAASFIRLPTSTIFTSFTPCCKAWMHRRAVCPPPPPKRLQARCSPPLEVVRARPHSRPPSRWRRGARLAYRTPGRFATGQVCVPHKRPAQ